LSVQVGPSVRVICARGLHEELIQALNLPSGDIERLVQCLNHQLTQTKGD
jgi:hypothetical protein